jgi:hypothetical protein
MIMYVGMFADLTFVVLCRPDSTFPNNDDFETLFSYSHSFCIAEKSQQRDNGALACHGRVLCDNKAAIK